jgi:hypothetical protein
MATELTIPHELDRRLVERGLLSRSSAVMGGALVFARTRVPASTLPDYLLEGASVDAFCDDFPSVDRQQDRSHAGWMQQDMARGENYQKTRGSR